mmetsp:Transcript_1433/g.2264  ORF Transcript_1433/g.2264 Transcript_1433/m.2264 type:complete len:3782 (+) Transcript_1433:192-11537(+)|eukprot:CAMPEP_0195308532 /NCGR_PEP_ID=MMETSP0707-20130614/38272_1 /TAXON_ID=33640 /ORGANISM="Asterionellopsis glacialis, Strain CCMP134" /LENGTH=3781 /DNA_ID=CAMNT_0040372805 /DNA_START=689 /DNA_END=12034 /DNA_ORIENTATION=-
MKLQVSSSTVLGWLVPAIPLALILSPAFGAMRPDKMEHFMTEYRNIEMEEMASRSLPPRDHIKMEKENVKAMDDFHYEPFPYASDELHRREEEEQHVERNLQTKPSPTEHIADFQTLACNIDLDDAVCSENRVSDIIVPNQVLDIPCGSCYTFDQGGEIELAGVNIKGKLYFEPNHKVIIKTPYVIVQGELQITDTNVIGGDDTDSVKFVLTGEDDNISFTPSDSNSNACSGECLLGKKAFIVAGGKLNIQGIQDESCPAWTTLIGQAQGDRVYLEPGEFLRKPQLPDSCSDVVFHSTFDGGLEHWDGNNGGKARWDEAEGALVVSERMVSWQGPQIDFTHLAESNMSCFVPNKSYLVHVRIKLTKAGSNGSDTECASDSSKCVVMYHKTRAPPGQSYINARLLLAQHPPIAGKYGEWIDLIGLVEWDPVQLSQDNLYHLLEIYGPGAGVDIHLDLVKIYLPSDESYLNPADQCYELLGNGDAEGNGIHPYPFFAGNARNPVYVLEEEDGNNFFRQSSREQWWSIMNAKVNHNCFKSAIIYTISMDVRIHSETPVGYYADMYGQYEKDGETLNYHTVIIRCPEQTIGDGWVTCKGDFTINPEMAAATGASNWRIVLNDFGSRVDIDYDNIKMTFKSGPVEGILVDDSVASCWGEGAEVHITSSTLTSDQAQSSVISEMTKKGDGTVSMKLQDPVSNVIGSEESEDFALEVALVSRNVKIQGDIGEEDMGGYLQVLHTPSIAQVLKGVEFKNMGQLTVPDRYPIQFLYSGDVNGTEVSKNVIRNSNQRCLVLDGTSNAVISDNVAYDYAGHCFYVGYESENNLLEGNLASSSTTKIQWNNRILDMDDHYLAAFFSVWRQNDWIGNVAAGGQGQGFRFICPWQVRGEDNQVISTVSNPRTKTLGIFKDNVAHSNRYDGFQGGDFYGELVKVENFKSYKNGGKGFYVWWSQNIAVAGGFFADNRIGVHFHYVDMVSVEDTEFRGLSNWMKEKTQQLWPKHSPGDPIVGIKIPPFLRNVNHRKGATLRNLFFTGFDNSPDNPGSIPIAFDEQMTDGKSFTHFNYVTSMENINVNDSRNVIIDACPIHNKGFVDVLIHDADGSSDPVGQSTAPSTIVSNSDNMQKFTSCTPYPNQCVAYCDGCLSTATYLVETDGSEDYVLAVEGIDNNAHFFGFDTSNGNEKFASSDSAMRSFTAAVAAGENYQANFLTGDGGQTVWPSFTIEKWDDPPAGCTDYAAVGDISMVVPDISCESNFVHNPDFESGTYDYWKHNNPWGGGEGIKIVQGAGVDDSIALSSDGRTSIYHGLSQWLDMRCISGQLGKYYEFKANFRMMLNGIGVLCDVNNADGCPSVTFGIYGYDDPATKEGEWSRWEGHKVRSKVPYEESSFGLIQGIFRVDQHLSSANRVLLKIEKGHPGNTDLVLDNISITPFEPSCDDNLVMNGDFSDGTSAFWGPWGHVTLSMVQGIDLTQNSALKSSGRTHKGWGQSQELIGNCLFAGDRIAVHAMVKYEVDSKTTFCNPFSYEASERCSDILLYSKSPSEEHWYHRAANPGVTSTTESDGWYIVSGVTTILEKTENAKRFALWFNDASTNYDVISDNVSVQRLPQDCNNMVLNSKLEDGTTAFWETFDRPRSKLGVSNTGGGYALRQYNRAHHWIGVGQTLDPRCLVENEILAVSASMQLLNSTNGDGAVCDPNLRWDNINTCPSLEIHASGCSGEPYIHQRYWNEVPFLNWVESGFNDFYAEVPITQHLSTCTGLRFKFYGFDGVFDLLLDDILVGIKGTTAPTPVATDTLSETPVPTPGEDLTSAPTASPTVSSAMICPETIEIPSQVNIGNEALPIMFARAETNKLCTLTKITVNENGETRVVPLARSYEGFDWETAAGNIASSMFLGQSWNCYDTGCQITLPPLEQGESYGLTSYSYDITEKDQIARLLESTTFGATRDDLNNFETSPSGIDTSISAWVQDQMDVTSIGITNHREFWRKRTNPMFVNPQSAAKPSHPCDPGSRWRRFAFTQKHSVWWSEHTLTYNGPGPYVVQLDGNPVTVVEDVQLDDGHVFDANLTYITCGRPEEFVGGRMYLRTEDGTCLSSQNPVVNFTGFENIPKHVIDLPSDGNLFREIDDNLAPDDMFILLEGLSSTTCNNIPDVTEEGDPHVFGRLPDNSWLIFDPRIVLEDNTDDSPIQDGGGSTELVTGGDTLCANAARTFLNEDKCILSTSSSACGAIPTPETLISLNEENLLTFLHLTGRYVYAIDKLTVEDSFGNKIEPVCTPGLRSRWKLKTESACNPSYLGSDTNTTLVNLLVSQSGDENPQFRDTHFPTEGVCDPGDTDPNVEILVDEQCWQRVHPDLMSVYDMTYWTHNDTHMGNMNAANNNRPHPIKKWADIDQTAILSYPSTHPWSPGYNHPITRWTNNHQRFTYVGRFGDSVRFRDLPNEIRLDQVAEWYNATGSITGSGVIVCGSPGEVSNDETLGTGFDFATGRDTTWNMGRNREAVWTSVALTAPDQLRQRVAFAFSQLLVIVRLAISSSDQDSESFLSYYDIFVRNAFGNYRDILKEISYSPLMAENLSYLQSKSAAYMFDTYGQITFADENFAREIMQLFSTGLVQLNIDGTPKLDENGQTILVYTNEDIMSFARAWTGFDYQRKRANVEERSWSGNHIDPMRIEAQWRDRFPKSGLNNGYIGDGYPLCVDFPDKSFLISGARYRLLGSSPLPELMTDPSEFASDSTIVPFELDQDSNLRTKLCNDATGSCDFEKTVVLTETLECVGQECDVDTVRVVKVGNMFYEYVSPPCVEQLFYKNAVKLLERHRNMQATCANPLLPVASEACCAPGSNLAAKRNSKYDRERMTYATAQKRCSDIEMAACDYTLIENDAWYKTGWHWAEDACLVRVKINTAGYAAIVYEPEKYFTKVKHVDDETRNFFKVYWDGDYPTASTGCGGCQSLSDGGCMCETTVREDRVFTGMPRSVEDALSKLPIGALDPSTFNPNTNPTIDQETGIAAYKQGTAFDSDTVFVFTDSKGRKHALKNARETVLLLDASRSSTPFSFRNAPTFMSLVPSEASARDAQYETEATLDEYFYHENTAPFLCIRMIQRLVTSNPSPRYIKTCANAFQSGMYTKSTMSFGSGKYGDLAAMVAAIVLDREARSAILDRDPSNGSLREALLKVIGVMRSMEFESSSSSPVVKFHDVIANRIGQMAHDFPTVFSFFLPEFQPRGRVADASLVGPEALIIDMPKIVNLLNGMFSLVKYGLSNCHSGFGVTSWSRSWNCNEGNYVDSGKLGFLPSSSEASQVVNELTTLLTSGRLSEENRLIVTSAYEKTASESNPEAALRIAQQLIVTSPEFHSTNPVKKNGLPREAVEQPQKLGINDYKAIVYVMFSGGCDSYNMLVPHTCETGKQMYDEYLEVRKQVAIGKQDLLTITSNRQACQTFGVHPSLPAIKELYDETELLFFANTGVLTVPSTKENYWQVSKTQLFAHNHMQREAKAVDPLDKAFGTGVIGRMSDILSSKGNNVGSFSIDHSSVALIGQPGVGSETFILGQNGISEFNPDPSVPNMTDSISALNAATSADSGFFAETWSEELLKSLAHNDLLHTTLSGITTTSTFPETQLGRKLEIVAKMIETREQRGVDMDMFYVEIGGFDTHADVEENLRNRFEEVNGAVHAFATELKSKNVWDKVVAIQTSEFARTLAPNSGDGTDHAWGGNYMMFGGAVSGGEIYGTYPDDLTDEGPLGLGRGRLIPETPWDSVFEAVAKWAGITDEEELDKVCPNRDAFPAEMRFNEVSLFQ